MDKAVDLLVVAFVILMVGTFTAHITSVFVDTNEYKQGSFLGFFINSFEQGIDIPVGALPLVKDSYSINISPIDWFLTDGMVDYIIDQLKALSFLPAVLINPIVILMTFSMTLILVYIVIRLMEGIGALLPFT